MSTQERGSLYPVKGPSGGVALALDRVEYPLESRQAAPDGTGPLRALRLPRRGTGGGETPAGRNPRRRKPPPEAKPAAKQQERGSSPRPQRGTGGGAPPAAGGGAPPWPRGSGGRGQGARAKARERRAAPAGGATVPGPTKGGWGPLPRSAEKGPATGRAGPHTDDCLRDAGGPQTLGGRVGRLCPHCGARRPGPQRRPRVRPRWPDRGSGRGAGPRRGPPTNPHQSGVETRRPEPKGKGSGRPGRPAQGPPEPQDGPERAGAGGPDGPRRPDDAGI